MKELVEVIAKALVDQPDEVVVKEKETEKSATRIVGPKARVFATLMGSLPLPGAEQNSGVRLVGDSGEVASFLELLERAPVRYSLTMPHEAE